MTWLYVQKTEWFKNNNNKLKTVDPQTNKNKFLKPKILGNVWHLFNDLYYIYKDKYNEEKDGLNTKDENFYTTKAWDLLMIINTSLKKKKMKKNNNNDRLVKSLIKRNQLKNQQKVNWVNFMNGLIEKKQA